MMSLTELAQWLEARPFAIAISEAPLQFPLLEIVHVMGLAIVVGSIAMIDLRLLGFRPQGRPLQEVAAAILPWTWIAFAVTVSSGLLLFSSRATYYYENTPFRMKFVLLALAGVNMLIFHAITAREMERWERGVPPRAARWAGALSLFLWASIVTAGRWAGFV